MNASEISHQYKRIIQYFWDPEPKNDDRPDLPIWCLGREYPPHPDKPRKRDEVAEDAGGADAEMDESHGSEYSSRRSSFIHLSSSEHTNAGSYENSSSNGVLSSFGQKAVIRDWPPAFLDDFEARIWMTYRSQFPPIPRSFESTSNGTDSSDSDNNNTTNDNSNNNNSNLTLRVRLRSQFLDTNGFTSDTGWGCMIRSGQSLLATALQFLKFGRDWRRGTRKEEENELLSLFADDPSAPFSIHRFVEYGASACGVRPGEWFGPSAAARCIQALAGECKAAGLNVYVSSDGPDIYERQFRDVACSGTELVKPTVVLFGVRLGIDRVTPVYWEALKRLLKCPQSIGIAGGRPSSSHYFVGVQGQQIFYLDPHQTRPSVKDEDGKRKSDYTDEEAETYHTRRLRRLHVQEMDPSMLIGFLIRDEDDWQDLKTRMQNEGGKRIIHIHPGYPATATLERAEAVEEVEAYD